MTRPDIMTALRSGTAEEHQALENVVPLASPELTIAEYILALQVFEAFVSEWETRAAVACPAHLRQFFAERKRAALLSADLQYFEAQALLTRPELPPLMRHGAFFGAMYVMEGSTLGGQLIARHLESHLGLRDGVGYSYFRGHGSDTGRMWKEFGVLLRHEAQSLNHEEIVDTARLTFLSFEKFFAATPKLQNMRVTTSLIL